MAGNKKRLWNSGSLNIIFKGVPKSAISLNSAAVLFQTTLHDIINISQKHLKIKYFTTFSAKYTIILIDFPSKNTVKTGDDLIWHEEEKTFTNEKTGDMKDVI